MKLRIVALAIGFPTKQKCKMEYERNDLKVKEIENQWGHKKSSQNRMIKNLLISVVGSPENDETPSTENTDSPAT